MTRATAIILCDNKMVLSNEFNGHGYPDFGSCGHFLVESLRDINDIESFKFAISEFNDTHFGYQDLGFFESPFAGLLKFDNGSYIGDYFSDYLYIRNVSKNSAKIIDANGEVLILKARATAIFYFGVFHSLVEDWQPPYWLPAKQQLIHKLKMI